MQQEPNLLSTPEETGPDGSPPPDGLQGHEVVSHVPVHYVAGTGRKLRTAAIVFLVILGIAFLVRHHFSSNAREKLLSETLQGTSAAPAVDVVQVGFAPATHVLTLPGETRAWYESTIYARANGYVEKWMADIGDRVHAGDLLATIATPELDDQLKAAMAKVAYDQAEVQVAQAAEKLAQSTYQRYQTSPKGVVSVQETEEKEAEFTSGSARLNASKSQVKLDEADVARLEDTEKFKRVTAPYNGIITDRHIDIGDLVTAGSMASNTILYGIAQSDKIRIFVDIPQSASAGIKVGMAAGTTAHGYTGTEFPGKVARTSNAIDPAARTLKVEVDIENPQLKLLPGMYVEVTFHVPEATSLVQIPASALNFRSAGPQVAVVAKNGTVTFRPVSIVRDMGEFVEITSGVAAGDMVALNISSQISDGDRVTATPVETPAAPPPPAKNAAAVADRSD